MAAPYAACSKPKAGTPRASQFELPKEVVGALFGGLAKQISVYRLPDQRATIKYVPLEALPRLLNSIPHGTVVSIVREDQADKPTLVVFNQVDLHGDRQWWPQWLATFCAETGTKPEGEKPRFAGLRPPPTSWTPTSRNGAPESFATIGPRIEATIEDVHEVLVIRY